MWNSSLDRAFLPEVRKRNQASIHRAAALGRGQAPMAPTGQVGWQIPSCLEKVDALFIHGISLGAFTVRRCHF